MAPAVLPGNPFHPVSRIAEAVVTGKLLAVAISMATLGSYQSQEVEFVQVYLQETATKKTTLSKTQADIQTKHSPDAYKATASSC